MNFAGVVSKTPAMPYDLTEKKSGGGGGIRTPGTF